MSLELEVRTQKFAPELRAARNDDSIGVIEGHFAVFNSLSEPIWGMYREELVPGCFKRSLKEKRDQKILFDHDAAMVLGCREAGTAVLEEDKAGLRGEVDLPDTSFARDLVVSMKRGDIDSASFGFYARTTRWRQEDGWDIREIHDLDLVEASVVTFPAYKATKLGVRGLLPDDFPQVHLVARAINRLENKLDIVEEDRSVLLEYRSLLSDRLPPDVMRMVSDVVGAPVAVTPLSTLQRQLELLELDA